MTIMNYKIFRKKTPVSLDILNCTAEDVAHNIECLLEKHSDLRLIVVDTYLYRRFKDNRLFSYNGYFTYRSRNIEMAHNQIPSELKVYGRAVGDYENKLYL